MTYKEAKQSILSYCAEECGMIESCDFINSNNCVEALALKALNKQIPTKPLYINEHDVVYFDWQCSSCKREYVNSAYGIKYCVDCGQAIDWNRKENNND